MSAQDDDIQPTAAQEPPIDTYHSLESPTQNAPVFQLPNEILSGIFLLCLLVSGEREKNCYAFSHVCRHWRAVALKYPTLWNYIRIILKEEKDIEPALDLVQTYLERSEQTPLNVHVYIVPEMESDPIFDVLLPHANRWRSVSLRGNAEDWEKIKVAKGQFAMLEHLHMALTDELPTNLDAFEGAPSLQHLSFLYLIDVDHLRFTWANITILEFSTVPASQVIGILDRCRNVEMLKCHSIGSSEPGFTSGLITLPRLRTAVFVMLFGNIGGDFGLDELFLYLNLPALTTLEVSTLWLETGAEDEDWNVDPWPHDRFLDMLTRSHCNLTRLSFWEVAVGADNLIQYLRAQPFIQCLKVADVIDERFPEEWYEVTVCEELTRALTVDRSKKHQTGGRSMQRESEVTVLHPRNHTVTQVKTTPNAMQKNYYIQTWRTYTWSLAG
ncbi:hypothetical protein AX16_006886 [Volvariella volvacea WC 439]|nr:hypothetical protein AX16_006886 [Volvariella volvacea WC 439]